MILSINTKYDNKEVEKYNSRGSDYLIMANTEWLDIEIYKGQFKFTVPQSCVNKNGRVNKYVNDSIDRLVTLVNLKKVKVNGSTVEKLKANNALRKAIIKEESYLINKGINITKVSETYRESLIS